jgi:hypothetical protein
MGLKKLGKWVKKNIKPIAAVASIVFPPLIPALGTAIAGAGASAAVIAATGAAALGAGASAIAGDKPSDILKNAALAGITAGTISKVSGAATAAADSAAAAGSNASSAYYTPPPTTALPTTAGVGAATGLFDSSSYTQPISTSPEGLISPNVPAPASSNLGVSTVGVAPTSAPSGYGYTTPAGEFMGPIAPTDTGIMSTLAKYGSGVVDFAKQNPQLAGSLLGALGGAVSAANAPKEQTTTTSIDPQIKAEYLANLERAKSTAANLGPREFAQPGAMYTAAEQNLYNLGMTPFGAADIQQFYNPYEQQVVQGALGDIERSRQMQDVADRARAVQARAFGGSRQGVQEALTNEAALRQAATTASGLRQTGFTQAANLGLAARPFNIAGLQTSMGLGAQRDALTQARLDAARNVPLERLAITGGALGLQPARTGETTSQPLYTSGIGSALSGGLTGAYIGSLLQPQQQPVR